METNEPEIVDSPNDTEETVTEQSPEIEALKKENATLKAQKDHWKEKANKPKPESKEEKAEEKVVFSPQLSEVDLLALMKADVLPEHIDTVKKWAKFNETSVADALKDKFLLGKLAEMKEEQVSAQVSNTRSTRTVSKVTDETIMENASKGKLPESDADIERLTEARMNAKLKK